MERYDYDGLLEVNSDLRNQLADAQAQIEALQTKYDDLLGKYQNLVAWYDKQQGTPCEQIRHQQQVEALQRERDHAKKMEAVQKEVADNQTWHVHELTVALDAERQRARTATQLVVETIGATGPEDLESALGRLVAQLDAEREKLVAVAKERDVQCTLKQNCIGMLEQEREKVANLRKRLAEEHPGLDEVCDKLTQLQALVRAFFEARCGHDQDKYVQAYNSLKATLDATTPAVCSRIGGCLKEQGFHCCCEDGTCDFERRRR